MSAVEGRTDVPLKRAHPHQFSQISDTNWLMSKPNDRRVRVSWCTRLTFELWPMTALRQKRTFRLGMWRDQNTKSQRSAAISLLVGRLICFEATTICNSPFLNH